MTSEGDLDQAQEQLRHRSVASRLQYTHPPIEDRRETLDEMG